MKNEIKLKSASIILISIPYLLHNSQQIYNSSFFNLSNIIILIIVLILTEKIFQSTLLFVRKDFKIFFSTFIVLALFILLYGGYLTDIIGKIILNITKNRIRGRIITIIYMFFALLVFYFRWKNISNYLYLNIFLIVFSLITFLKALVYFRIPKSIKLENNYINIKQSTEKNKPIILIIVDEYGSPGELFKLYKDIDLFNLQKNLKETGWIVKDDFFSYETSTFHSLTSMFNFNISKSNQFSNQDISIETNNKIPNSLEDSLTIKNVAIYNFGIIPFGKYSSVSNYNITSSGFIEDVMRNSLLFIILNNTSNLSRQGLEIDFNPNEKQNKFIINKLIDTTLRIKAGKTFIYSHLMMPHAPFKYGSEFDFKENTNVNYQLFYKFTNIKLEKILRNLTKENKYKIIVTGDHGYRNASTVDPHITMGAFYGFENKSIEKVETVQDIGSLINGNY